MKILVLAEDYSRPNGYVSLHYIHSRNKLYVNRGIDVSVLSFKSKEDYMIDGVKVITLQSYEKNQKKFNYDLLLSHAPNIRNHFKFLVKYQNEFKDIIFFFHGHEVLKTSEIYPKPYDYIKGISPYHSFAREVYDMFKLAIWRHYFVRISYKSQFIFVSKWMYDMFLHFVKINPEKIKERSHIIYNCIGDKFEEVSYDLAAEKKYDFISIRNNIDGSKYGIDIVTRIAENNPKFSFCVIGKGNFYKYNKKPNNLIWIDRNLEHEEILNFLNQSRCALIPTRADSQGVMACEIATFGIPMITSDIKVCEEIFDDFKNVGYINNEQKEINIESLFLKLTSYFSEKKNTKYFAENTIGREIELFKRLRG